MSEDHHYDSASNKRKYEEQTAPPPPPPRRSTGFSAPILPQSNDSAPTSYNSVPPPAEEIQLAKQRAQEIAARLFNNATANAAGAAAAAPLESKRPRFDNGGGYDSGDNRGFSSVSSDYKSHGSMSAASSIPVSYGFQGSSKKIDVPNGRVGVIIGKGGETIKYLQLQSGAKIQVTRDTDADLNSSTRVVELMGTPEQISKAEELINDVLAGAESGGQSASNRRAGGYGGGEQFVMQIPNNKVGLIIGKGGETIKNMQARTGAKIQVIPLHLPPGDTSNERTLQIDGSSDQIESAKQLVNEIISSENRSRNQSMSGGYGQQGYQARPPQSWGPPPIQQSGYPYSGPPSQYNAQGSYPGYPPQQSAGGGYSSNWDQSTQQGGGYDYYGQQQSAPQQNSGAPVDNSGYGYGQPPASGYQHQGQGYSHEGYGGYQAPPPYDQQQQGYSSQGYGNAGGAAEAHSSYGSGGDSSVTQAPTSAPLPPPPPSSAGQQGYTTTQPSPNPGSQQGGYGPPPTSQTGYGGPSYGAPPPPQGQNPQAYGQATQSPSTTTPGGYGNQPGYHSQPPPTGYAQPESGSQRGPPSGYQSGYGAPPPYGGPPAGNQPGYGAYNASYGGGYSQPPPYAGDGSSGGARGGAYDGAAPPASQGPKQSGAAKKSPQS